MTITNAIRQYLDPTTPLPTAIPTSIDLASIKKRTWQSQVSYTPSNLISYNLSLGVPGTDLTRCWESHPSFHVLPSFAFLAVVHIMGHVTNSMPDFLPSFRPYNHVHAEHFIETYRPFRTDELHTPTVLASEARILDITNRSDKGVTVKVGITTYDKTNGNKKLCYNEWTSFIRHIPGIGAPSSSSSPSPPPPPNSAPTTSGTTAFPHDDKTLPDATLSHRTTPSQSALYRATTTEWNPMHISPVHAAQGGFQHPILSGSCTIGIGIRHVIDTWAAGDVRRFKSARMRLSKPVLIGEEIETEMWFRDAEGGGVEKEKTGGFKTIVYRQVVRGDGITKGAEGEDKVVIRDGIVQLWDFPRSWDQEKL